MKKQEKLDPPQVVKDSQRKKPKEQPFWKRALLFSLEAFVIILIALVITSLLRIYVFQVFEVPSGSMEHTLNIGDRIIAVRTVTASRGDVVVFKDPDNAWLPPQPGSTNPIRKSLEQVKLLPDSSQGFLVKRLIGLPGDHVKCCNVDGLIEVNDVAIDETGYLYKAGNDQVRPSDNTFDVVVPKDRIFVMGDHRDHSGDSRLHMCDDSTPQGLNGFVPISDIVGPVKLRIWPVNRFDGLKRPDWASAVKDNPDPAPDLPVISPDSCNR